MNVTGSGEGTVQIAQPDTWEGNAVLIFNGHGQVDWFFGAEPGKEAAAVAAVSTWVRAYQTAQNIVFDAIVLASCHSGEELKIGENDPEEGKNYTRCPARLLSEALAGVRVVGYHGNARANMGKVKVRDINGKEKNVGMNDGAVVFLNGGNVKGAQEDVYIKSDKPLENDYYNILWQRYNQSWERHQGKVVPADGEYLK